MLAGSPNFGTVNFFAAYAGLSPAGRESKRENAEGYGLQAVRQMLCDEFGFSR
jgi:hypothetical protein